MKREILAIATGRAWGKGKKDVTFLNKFKTLDEAFSGVVKSEKVDISECEDVANEAKEKGIIVLDFWSKCYPSPLKEIINPPVVLFVKGVWKKYKLPIAIVGTRYPSGYGEQTTKLLATELGRLGFTIVSGMARGIDSIAHKYALLSKTYTVAVLGSGVDVVYPPENRKLYESICENGVIISEYEPQTPPYAFNFPSRNRIISGLSLATVVTEAGIRSGSLITAHYAVEQNRMLFSVPGEIFSKRSQGTNKIISEGACILTGLEDILLRFYPDLKRVQETTAEEKRLLGDKEDLVLRNMEGETYFDELVEKTGMEAKELSEILTDLELSGVVKRSGGNIFIKT
ncbi:MAG: DNA-processing protein DprA [Deltaproteobacteria bacterium]|nr:DNA-processing protein DprA [Deltaproteobacteria bacterium]